MQNPWYHYPAVLSAAASIASSAGATAFAFWIITLESLDEARR